MTDLLNQLVSISRHYGAQPQFVLAGGGNTSAKTKDRLFVKASGTSLATIDEGGFVEMNRAALSDLLNSNLSADANQREEQFKNAVLASRVHPGKRQRPSVEALLHDLIPTTFVVHSHATLVNTITCASAGETITRKLFGDDVLWIPYVDPGFILAKTLDSLLKSWQHKTGRKAPLAIFMANHGLIVAGESADDISLNTDRVLTTIRSNSSTSDAPFGAVASLDTARRRAAINVVAPALRGLLATNSETLKIVTFDDSPLAIALAGGENGKSIALAGPLTPDQIVYCQGFPAWFELEDAEPDMQLVARLRSTLEPHKLQRRFAPNVVVVKGLGVFAIGDDFAAADTARQVYLDAISVMAGAVGSGGVSYLTREQYEFIENWEVEAYRKRISAGAGSSGRVRSKVALVTGAAQGFGYEISADLVAQGAHVILTDMNIEKCREGANGLAAKAGKGRAIGIAIDVTDGASVDAAIHQTVRTFGGLDVLVSSAGVLKAGSVKTLAERDFDFVTAVNYKGYFVCVQKVAPVLAVQRLAEPGYWSDIIQINSKSGLQGSNKNGAYAGSKFGGIGLTQSFALELVEDGIKVNCICPGNFFDGPLWSDPKTGLFVQYLTSGKVPGAKTVDDVKRFYEAKVPMLRGCRTTDVMKAIYYLIDQKYETGQAVPVSGGQVMLK